MIPSEEKTKEEIESILSGTIDVQIPKIEDFDFLKEREEK